MSATKSDEEGARLGSKKNSIPYTNCTTTIIKL
jgi:hypothetical protein